MTTKSSEFLKELANYNNLPGLIKSYQAIDEADPVTHEDPKPPQNPAPHMCAAGGFIPPAWLLSSKPKTPGHMTKMAITQDQDGTLYFATLSSSFELAIRYMGPQPHGISLLPQILQVLRDKALILLDISSPCAEHAGGDLTRCSMPFACFHGDEEAPVSARSLDGKSSYKTMMDWAYGQLKDGLDPSLKSKIHLTNDTDLITALAWLTNTTEPIYVCNGNALTRAAALAVAGETVCLQMLGTQTTDVSNPKRPKNITRHYTRLDVKRLHKDAKAWNKRHRAT